MLRPLQVLHSTFSINLHPPNLLIVSYHSMVAHHAVSCNDTGLVPKHPKNPKRRSLSKEVDPKSCGRHATTWHPRQVEGQIRWVTLLPPESMIYMFCLKETKKKYISSVQTTEQYILLFGSQDLMGRLSPENNF